MNKTKELKVEYIGIKEAADILDVVPETVRRWARARIIPHYYIGGRYRFVPDELVRAMRNTKREPRRVGNIG